MTPGRGARNLQGPACPCAVVPPCPPQGVETLEGGGDGDYIQPVGLTTVRMQVANFAAPDVAEELEFLVDSGAAFSVVPGEVLARLGIERRRERQFSLANATCIVRGCGVALFRYGDRDAIAEVIFGEPGDAVLLGALTLEAMGLCLDPLKRELLTVPMILAACGPAQAPVASVSARRAVRVTTTVTAAVAAKPRTRTA